MARCDNCPQRRGQKCVGTFQDIETSIDELQNDLLSAIMMVYDNDEYLLKTRVNEVCITSHIFRYFANEFSEKYHQYNIDPEYSRFGEYSKFYEEVPNGRDRYAKPDLLIHRRNCNKHNLLYIEFKPYWNPNVDDDYYKIRKFISNEAVGGIGTTVVSYRYKYGVSILLGENTITFVWFQNGSTEVVREVTVSVKKKPNK